MLRDLDQRAAFRGKRFVIRLKAYRQGCRTGTPTMARSQCILVWPDPLQSSDLES